MDDELRRAFGSFSDEVRAELKKQGEISLQAHEDYRKELQAFRSTQEVHGRLIASLWKKVRGSDPPPNGTNPPAVVSKPAPPLDEQVEELDDAFEDLNKQVSEHDLVIPGIQGQIIALDSKQTAFQKEVRQILGEQSNAMGLTEKKPKQVRRESVVRQWSSLIAAITGLITAGVGAYYTLTHAFPPPAPTPSPTATHASP